MQSYNQVVRILFFVSFLLVGACVTINIYFPAEKVESVAGEIVDDIRGPRPEEQQNSGGKTQGFLSGRSLLASLVTVAWAQDATTVSNAAIRELKERMKIRYAQLKPWFANGVLSEGNDGFVATVNTNSLGLKEKSTVRNLVTAENNDRKNLYREVAKALNIDPSQTGRIAEIFANEWQKSL